MKRFTLLSAAVLILSLPGCLGRYYYGTGNFVGTKAFKSYKETSLMQVRGRACHYTFPGVLSLVPYGTDVLGFGEMSLNAAYKDAIEKSPPGTDSLSNVNIRMTYPFLVWVILDVRCVVVEAYPAKITDQTLFTAATK